MHLKHWTVLKVNNKIFIVWIVWTKMQRRKGCRGYEKVARYDPMWDGSIFGRKQYWFSKHDLISILQMSIHPFLGLRFLSVTLGRLSQILKVLSTTWTRKKSDARSKLALQIESFQCSMYNASWLYIMMSLRMQENLDYAIEHTHTHHIYHSQNKLSNQGPSQLWPTHRNVEKRENILIRSCFLTGSREGSIISCYA